jgi:serine/threonine protein kinase
MKVIAPRLPTPVTPASGRTGSRLPDDLVADQVQRLKLFCLVSGGFWAVGLLMDAVVAPRTLGFTAPPRAIRIEITAVVTAMLLFLYVRYAPRSPQAKSDMGVWLMVLNAAGIAALETWAIDPSLHTLERLSWLCIVILLSAMIMPSTPRKMAVAAFVSASLSPLGVWFAYLRGVDVPSVVQTLVMSMPNYTCAVAAVLPSLTFQRLGRRLREARELGNYELIEQLGRGGMGEVWRARHRLLARHAAIKLVRPEMLGAANESEAKAVLRRFEREAQATSALSSQHSIRLFDFGVTDEGTFYYVMELLSGRDLESLVREFGPLPADRTMYLLRQVCHSLAEAHERGLIHRDVKPANIYLCRMGLDYDFVKVLDFGLVKLHETHLAEGQTQTLMTAVHSTLGTPAYMAPEIILGHSAVDRRADVYALGCVWYFLLTGQLVFEGSTPMQAVVDHVHASPLPPSQRTELRIPAEIDAMVLACLEKNPDRRPQDAAALLQMMEQCTTCTTWSNARAREWWQTHLPDLSGPLTFVEEQSEAGSPLLVRPGSGARSSAAAEHVRAR